MRLVTRSKAVSDAKDCLDPPVSIVAKLLAKAAHVHIDSARSHSGTIAPDFPQECVTGENLACMLDYMGKKLILFPGQVQSISV
jgi:hypothetical protein